MAIYVAKSKSEKSFQNTPFSQNVHPEGGVCQIFLFFEGTPLRQSDF